MHVSLHERVSKSGETMTRQEEFWCQNMSEWDQNSDGNEWLVMENGRRTENEEETDKKDERNEKAKMYHLRHSLLMTTPQHSLSRFMVGYQPISKHCKCFVSKLYCTSKCHQGNDKC